MIATIIIVLGFILFIATAMAYRWADSTIKMYEHLPPPEDDEEEEDTYYYVYLKDAPYEESIMGEMRTEDYLIAYQGR